MTADARDAATRRADTLAMLTAPAIDVWVATASAAGAPDPRRSTGYEFLVLRPVRVQAWREVNEIPGRTLMRGGTWLV